MVSPDRKRRAVDRAQKDLGVSERRACQTLGQSRSTQRYRARLPKKDAGLVAQLHRIPKEHPRHGYRMVTWLLRSEGWDVNRKRVQRLWRQEGLKVPRKTCKKRSRGNSENGTQRKSAERVNHVWSYGFVHDQTEDGRPLKWLPVMDRVQPGKSGTGGGPRDEGRRCSGSAGSAGGGARCARIHPE